MGIVSNDPATPVAVYTLFGRALALEPVAEARENVFASWFASILGGGNHLAASPLFYPPKDSASLTALRGTQTATLTLVPTPPKV